MSDIEKYLHGYNSEEQSRLLAQARILESAVFRDVEYAANSHILEVGCGVGAQTEILLERFSSSHVTAIDRSETQTRKAVRNFEHHKFSNRVKIETGEATAMPFADQSFDGAFVCWVLEHSDAPLKILKEVRRCLLPSAPIHLNEVFNKLFHIGPENSAFVKYWCEYNQLQGDMGGNPQVGMSLGYLLTAAGFDDIEIETTTQHWDVRDKKSRQFMSFYLENLLLSGAPALLKSGRVDETLISALKSELRLVDEREDGVLYFAWMKARARAPLK